MPKKCHPRGVKFRRFPCAVSGGGDQASAKTEIETGAKVGEKAKKEARSTLILLAYDGIVY